MDVTEEGSKKGFRKGINASVLHSEMCMIIANVIVKSASIAVHKLTYIELGKSLLVKLV